MRSAEAAGGTLDRRARVHHHVEPGRAGTLRRGLVDHAQLQPDRLRTARFVSAIALAMPSGRVLETEGTCEGVVGHELRGHNGFGYDPLFYIGERSFAEFSAGEKDSCSHRANALAAFVQALPDFMRSEG